MPPLLTYDSAGIPAPVGSPPNLNIADGVLTGTTPTTWAVPVGVPINIAFTNVGTQAGTLLVTLTRTGRPARRVGFATLDPDEKYELTGLLVDAGDVLSGQLRYAGTFEFRIWAAPPGTPFGSRTFSDFGRPSVTGAAFAPDDVL